MEKDSTVLLDQVKYSKFFIVQTKMGMNGKTRTSSGDIMKLKLTLRFLKIAMSELIVLRRPAAFTLML